LGLTTLPIFLADLENEQWRKEWTEKGRIRKRNKGEKEETGSFA